MVRIFREVGAIVRQIVFSQDMNVEVAADVEVFAQDLLCFVGVQSAVGVQLAVHVTLRGGLSAEEPIRTMLIVTGSCGSKFGKLVLWGMMT